MSEIPPTRLEAAIADGAHALLVLVKMLAAHDMPVGTFLDRMLAAGEMPAGTTHAFEALKAELQAVMDAVAAERGVQVGSLRTERDRVRELTYAFQLIRMAADV